VLIADAIREEADKLARRHHRRLQALKDEARRQRRRTTAPYRKSKARQPAHWELDDGFNPFRVRNRADRIAHAIAERLAAQEYEPRHPVESRVEKLRGGFRTVNIYQVADAALSRELFGSVLRKNLPVLSRRAYAYRRDVSAQDAVHYLRSELTGRSRVYVADYDFREYFNHISHDSVMNYLDEHFFVTDSERAAVAGFLRVGACPLGTYVPDNGPVRPRGIPQGTSVSLLLANVAAWGIDRALEAAGVGFVRYADDTLLWSEDYSRLNDAVLALHEQARSIGVSINVEKSGGIRLVTNEPRAEIRHSRSVEYLGYEIGIDTAIPSSDAVTRFRQRVHHFIWTELLREPTAGTQDLSRLSASVDRDYVSLVWRLRGYVYGDLSEQRVRRYLAVDPPDRRYRGFVAAYPLVHDPESFSALDGWLLGVIHAALKQRAALLASPHPGPLLPPPHGLSRDQLKRFRFRSSSSGALVDARLPSARRMAHVVTRAAAIHGPSDVGRPNPQHY
jgi:RNA-directed DNA polymerase